MNIYLPIAELSVNVFVLLGLGAGTGVLAGMFGVGGGFLMTPLLIFIGVSPSVAVATAANQIIASSLSGFLAHMRRGNVDFKMGLFLLLGGVAGSTLGVCLFRWLKDIGHIDLLISLCYVTFLGIIGAIMASDSLYALLKIDRKSSTQSDKQTLGSRLPFKMHFPRSNLTISVITPVLIGFFVGIMVSLMGIGGGFFLVPAMIYILGMPTSMVIGTSLFQIIFITANVTFLQAVTTQTVDILMAFILLSGSVLGAQFGTQWGAKIPAEYLRAMLAALVLGVAVKLAFGLFTPPDNIYTVSILDD
ncbi:MAG: sulfite exporter TauE/SafE family protein [Alphaproteobacteria bacterium]|nr:sulfite exporter TauE/SafE family protein [Alphaproteobacteria bacterium]